MTWFNLGFPLVMILLPLGFICCFRNRAPDEATAALARRGLVMLVVATLVALGLFAVAWTIWGPIARFSWVLFFPLWFGWAMPAAAARNPDWAASHPRGVQRRSASLVVRQPERFVPTWFWLLPGLLFVGGLVAIGLRPWSPGFDEATRFRTLLAFVIQLTCGGLFIILPLVALPAISREPEPMDASGSPALAQAYADLRRFKGRSMAWLLGLGLTAMVSCINVSMAWVPGSGRTGLVLGVAGAVAGTLIGLAGAVVGTMASARRARINGLLRELEAASPTRTA